MRMTYNIRPKQSSWFKWILIILCLIIVTCFIYGILLYNTIQKDKTTGFIESEEMVLQDTDLVKINGIERYHGEDAYHVVYGETEDQESKIVFVPLRVDESEDKQDLIIVDQTEITSKESIQKQWQQQCNNCKLIKIIPGIENDQLLWELTYIDDSNRHVLEYVSIYDGSQYEQFRFTQMYQ